MLDNSSALEAKLSQHIPEYAGMRDQLWKPGGVKLTSFGQFYRFSNDVVFPTSLGLCRPRQDGVGGTEFLTDLWTQVGIDTGVPLVTMTESGRAMQSKLLKIQKSFRRFQVTLPFKKEMKKEELPQFQPCDPSNGYIFVIEDTAVCGLGEECVFQTVDFWSCFVPKIIKFGPVIFEVKNAPKSHRKNARKLMEG